MKPLKLFYAWDMGSNWGHIGCLLAILPALHQAGFCCVAAIPDARAFADQLDQQGIEVFSAPRSEPRGKPSQPPRSLAHILFNRGYGSVDELSGMVLCWRSLLQAVRPAVVLVDAAPAALLAADSLGLPSLNMSVPFFIPPEDVSTPDFYQQGAEQSGERNHGLCSRIIQTVSQVRNRFGLTGIGSMADLYKTTDPAMSTFAEFDTFAPRASAPPYRGSIWDMGIGQPFQWPSGVGPRLFCYLRPPEQAQALLRVLKGLGWPSVCYCPGLTEEQKKVHNGGNIFLSETPLSMSQVVREAELAVNYGSHGVVSGLLLHGIPQLLLPYDAEKELISRCAVTLGAGIRPTTDRSELALMAALKKLAEDRGFHTAATAFSKRYGDTSQQKVVAAVVQSCLTLAGCTTNHSRLAEVHCGSG